MTLPQYTPTYTRGFSIDTVSVRRPYKSQGVNRLFSQFSKMFPTTGGI